MSHSNTKIIRHFEYNFLSASENNFKRNNIHNKLFNPIEHWNFRFITNLLWRVGDVDHRSNCNFLFNDFKGSTKKLGSRSTRIVPFFRRTLLSGIQHVFMVHLLARPSYKIVFFAAGRVATRWYRALKLKACSCRAGTSLVVLFPVYYLPVRADFPRETMGKRRIKGKGKEEGRRIEAGSSVS